MGRPTECHRHPPATARPGTTGTRPRSRSTSHASTSNPPGDHQRFPGVKQPAYIRGNVYAAGAHASDGEQDALVLDGAVTVGIVDEGDAVYLQTQLPEGVRHGQR